MASTWYALSMTTTLDKAGRVVIPSEVRKRHGLTAGTELELAVEGFAIRLIRAHGRSRVCAARRAPYRSSTCRAERSHRGGCGAADRRGTGAVDGVRGAFFDTSVFVA